MKKKHTAKKGYKTGDDIKKPLPWTPTLPGGRGKPPILWVKKKGKVVKATEEEIKIASKASKKKSPKKIMIAGHYVKKGGKV